MIILLADEHMSKDLLVMPSGSHLQAPWSPYSPFADFVYRPALSKRRSLFDGPARASNAKNQVVVPQVLDLDRIHPGVSQETPPSTHEPPIITPLGV